MSTPVSNKSRIRSTSSITPKSAPAQETKTIPAKEVSTTQATRRAADAETVATSRRAASEGEIAARSRVDGPATSSNAPASPLQQVLDKNPSIKTNQDLINHCYAEGGGGWSGAEKHARGLGVDINQLVKNRSGDVRDLLPPSSSPPPSTPPAEAPPSTPPGSTTPPATEPPVATPPVTAPPAGSETPPLTQLLDGHPEIKTNQDLFNQLYKQGGSNWEGAVREGDKVGVNVNDLVANRQGNPRDIVPRPTLPTAPVQIDQPPMQEGVPGQLGEAYTAYRNQLDQGVTLDPAYAGKINSVMEIAEDRMPLIDEIARKADLPREVVAAIWYREAGNMPTDVYLHNGEKLGKPTTLVPAGVFFRKDQFVEAAVDALRSKRGVADKLGLHYGSKDVAAMAAYTEAYNGFGFRNRGVESGYVTAGTDLYKGGRYVADGVYDANAWEQRPGSLPLMMEMMRRFP